MVIYINHKIDYYYRISFNLVLRNWETYGIGFLIVPVRLFTLVISKVSLNRKSALSLMVPCAEGIVTISCLKNIRSAVTRLDRPSIICSSSRKVCCCCSNSRLSRSVQFISSKSSWISFWASRRSLWSGCDWSRKKVNLIFLLITVSQVFLWWVLKMRLISS